MNNVTVPMDKSYFDRLVANEMNKAFRRCKIGKVTPKFKTPLPGYPFPFVNPIRVSEDPWYKKFREAADKGSINPCEGCTGACGNAYCPRRGVVTC